MRVKVKDIRFYSLSGRPFSTKTVEEFVEQILQDRDFGIYYYHQSTNPYSHTSRPPSAVFC